MQKYQRRHRHHHHHHQETHHPLNSPRNAQLANLAQHILHPRVQIATGVLISGRSVQVLLHLRHAAVGFRAEAQLDLDERFEGGVEVGYSVKVKEDPNVSELPMVVSEWSVLGIFSETNLKSINCGSSAMSWSLSWSYATLACSSLSACLRMKSTFSGAMISSNSLGSSHGVLLRELEMRDGCRGHVPPRVEAESR